MSTNPRHTERDEDVKRSGMEPNKKVDQASEKQPQTGRKSKAGH